jgi:proline iminopeptidase
VSGADGAVLADDGCRLWMSGSGPGEPLVLCHGGPGLWDMFGTLAPLLTGAVRVIRWDQRGCGRSDRRGPYSLARSTGDLDAVRAHLGLSQMAVLGHSWARPWPSGTRWITRTGSVR